MCTETAGHRHAEIPRLQAGEDVKSPVPGSGKFTSLLVAVAVTGLFAACGQHTGTTPANSPAVQPQPPPSSAAPPVAYDISRVDNVRNDFPPGFIVEAQTARTLSQADIESSRITAVTEGRIQPPDCRTVVMPSYAEPSVGADAAEVTAAGGHGSVDLDALRSPQPVPAAPKAEGCGLGMVVSGLPDVAGPAERIQAPSITGVATTGAKLVPEKRNPVYIFTAALDDRTSVVVTGSTDAQLSPEKLMSELLVKATAAVRGQ
jgi:hypothetical protein